MSQIIEVPFKNPQNPDLIPFDEWVELEKYTRYGTQPSKTDPRGYEEVWMRMIPSPIANYQHPQYDYRPMVFVKDIVNRAELDRRYNDYLDMREKIIDGKVSPLFAKIPFWRKKQND